MPVYDAFISYSHAKDKPIAAALQSVIQKLGKPGTSAGLARVPRRHLPLGHAAALAVDRAGAGPVPLSLLLSSPEAAASPWVGKEVEYWLANKSTDTLFIGVTDGTLDWDDEKGISLDAKTPLPEALKGRFPPSRNGWI